MHKGCACVCPSTMKSRILPGTVRLPTYAQAKPSTSTPTPTPSPVDSNVKHCDMLASQCMRKSCMRSGQTIDDEHAFHTRNRASEENLLFDTFKSRLLDFVPRYASCTSIIKAAMNPLHPHSEAKQNTWREKRPSVSIHFSVLDTTEGMRIATPQLRRAANSLRPTKPSLDTFHVQSIGLRSFATLFRPSGAAYPVVKCKPPSKAVPGTSAP